jgi:tight adherence protein B
VATGLSGLLLAASAALVAGVGGWLHARGRRRRRADDVRRQTTEGCDALVAELRAGQPAARALGRVAEEHRVFRPAAHASALGGDVPAALCEPTAIASGGAGPASGGLAALAAAWQVADDCGSGLAGTLDRVADGLRAEESTRAEVASALAPARATARLLAVLPVFGLLLGSGLGGDPVGLLLGSPVGQFLLLGGVVLSAGGTLWVERIADTVEGA